MDRATKERGPCKKQRSDISQYRPTESVSICFSHELNRVSSLSLCNNIR